MCVCVCVCVYHGFGLSAQSENVLCWLLRTHSACVWLCVCLCVCVYRGPVHTFVCLCRLSLSLTHAHMHIYTNTHTALDPRLGWHYSAHTLGVSLNSADESLASKFAWQSSNGISNFCDNRTYVCVRWVHM
jgi:hypothetical protein